MLRDEGESGNSLTRKIKSITSTVNEVLPEVAKEGLTSKTGRLRKTAHEYPKVFSGDYGQVRDFIVVEASMLGKFEPYRSMEISSFIFEMMIVQGQGAIAEVYDLLPFAIKVLDIKRTLCEKIMSLVRFSYDEDPIGSLRNKIRHTYDIHKLLQLPEMDKFFKSKAFKVLLNTVGNDDVDSFRNNNEWLVHHPKEAIIFKDTDKVWLSLKSTYTGSFSNLVYGELPGPDLIVEDLKRIAKRLHEIDWNINLDS